jgi:hypothetical protein
MIIKSNDIVLPLLQLISKYIYPLDERASGPFYRSYNKKKKLPPTF